jgi:uncharacterized protein (DUF1800 family)
MRIRSLPYALTIGCLAIGLASTPALARKKKTATPAAAKPPAPVVPMTASEKPLHALNRLAFGPRPGELQALDETGLKKWIEEQLHPESIAENPDLEAKLAPLDTLRMSTMEMVQKYPPNNLVKQMVDGKVPWPQDPQTRVVIQKVAQRYRDKLGLPLDATDKFTFDQAVAEVPQEQQEFLKSGTPEQKVSVLQSLPVEQQFDVVTTMAPEQRRKMFEVAPLSMRRRMQTFAGTQQLVNQDLADAKLFRAVYSNRQLEEVLTDFWYNHFNVYLDKGADRYMVTSYERDAIRPFVLGKFKDLLLATAQSPAMLFYLDNFQSVRADLDKKNADPKAKRAKRGLNENYGRELMELHTLGVDGGYTQKDVTEVARCFTGWTVREPRRGGGFEFNEKQHDQGEKHVLGVTIPANGGIEDGYKVIEILSLQPATAHFISKSLAIRFVSDTPPEALVDRMAATFQKTDGDLREVMRTMVYSPEFWSKDAYHAKIKSPFEMVVSALRATNADVDYTNAISGQLNQLGEPLYRKQEPTGYSNKGSDWMNSAALLGRMNFALNLAANHVNGVKVVLPATTDPQEMARDLMGADPTPASLQIVQSGLAAEAAAAANPAPDKPAPKKQPTGPALVAGLTLGSPDFQRR